MRLISSSLNNSAGRRWAWAWLGVFVAVVAYLVWSAPLSRLNSHLDFLPAMREGDIPQEVVNALSDRGEREMIWAVSAPGADGPAAAEEFMGCLFATGAFTKLTGQVSDVDRAKWIAFVSRYAVALIPPPVARALQDPAGYAQFVRSQLYSPFAGVSAAELAQDPLLLSRARQAVAMGRLGYVDGWLSATDDTGEEWRLIFGTLKPGVLANPRSLAMVALEERVARSSVHVLYPKAQIAGMGALFVAANYQEKTFERLRAWFFPLLGLFFLLFVGACHTPRPFFLWLLACVVGTACGVAAVFALFGQMHVHVLAMGTAFCGFTSAFCVYWLVICRQQGFRARALKMQWAFLCLLLALSFAPTALAPFQQCEEVAVLAVVGLAAAVFTCWTWYPFLAQRLPARFQPWEEIFERLAHRSLRPLALFVLVLLLAATAGGLWQLKPAGQPAFTKDRPAAMVQEEAMITQLIGEDPRGRSFVVTGTSLDDVLTRTEALTAKITALFDRGLVRSWSPLTLLSERSQQTNMELVKKALEPASTLLSQAGIAVVAQPYRFELLDEPQWAQSSFGQLQWTRLVKTPRYWASVVYVQASPEGWSQLTQLAQPSLGIYWLDRPQIIADGFAGATFNVLESMGLGLLLMLVFLITRFGVRSAVYWLGPAVFGMASSAALSGWFAVPFNLFTLLAMLPVATAALSFVVILREPALAYGSRLWAVTVAMIGMLGGFSLLFTFSAFAVRNFGLSIACGIAVAYIASLSFLALTREKQ